MARTRAVDFEEKQRGILVSAAAVFAEMGMEKASMAQIAAHSNVSKALLYHYYPSKDALIFDVRYNGGGHVSPLLLEITVVLWLTLGTPVLIRQRRVGRGGHVFGMYKFRTMHVSRGPSAEVWARPDDPRFRSAVLLRWMRGITEGGSSLDQGYAAELSVSELSLGADDATRAAYEIVGFPHLVVVDSDGRIASVFLGQPSLADLRRAIQAA